MDLIITVLLLIICYITGHVRENNHYKDIRKREIALYKKHYLTYAKKVNVKKKVLRSKLIVSSVVLACDHFKVFLANLKNIFGGNVSAYESVLDRARREATLRVREQAKMLGFDIVLNTKIDTVMLNPVGTRTQPQVCVTVYGTAVKYEK